MPDSSSTEQCGDDQQRGGDPRGDTVGERAADRETDETGRALTIGRNRRRSGPQMPTAPAPAARSSRSRRSAGAGIRVGFGAHQQDADGGDQDRQQHRPRRRRSATPSRSGADRAGGVEPELAAITTARPNNASGHDPVPAVSRFDLARPAHRARGGATPWPASATSPAPLNRQAAAASRGHRRALPRRSWRRGRRATVPVCRPGNQRPPATRPATWSFARARAPAAVFRMPAMPGMFSVACPPPAPSADHPPNGARVSGRPLPDCDKRWNQSAPNNPDQHRAAI